MGVPSSRSKISMKRYKLIYSLILVLVIGTTPLYGQQNAVDSLTGLLSPSLTELQKAELLIQLTRANRYVDINAAVKAGYEAHQIAQVLESEGFEIQAIRELATSLIGKGEWDDALALLDRGLVLSRKNKAPQSTADLLAIAAYIYRRKGNNEQSLAYYTEGLAISEANDYPGGIAAAEKGLGDLSERRGEYEIALEHYGEALRLAGAAADQELMANTLNAIAIIYDYQGDFDKALANYLRAYTVAEADGNLVKAGSIAGNVGSVHFYLENDEKALEYYLKSVDLAKTTQNKDGLGNAYQGVVTVYNRLGDTEAALEYALLDLAIKQEIGDVRGLSYVYKNLGAIYRKNEDLVKAEEYYLLGLSYAETTGQQIKIAVLNLQLGRLFNDWKKHRQAIPYLERVVEITKEIEVDRELSLAYEDLASAHSGLNQMSKAYDYLKKFADIKERLLSQEINEQTVKMQTVFETKARDEKIISLKNESALREEVITQAGRVRNLLLLGTGLLLLLAGLLYNRNRVKQRYNTLLVDKNTEIEAQKETIQQSLEEKETLLREIHHRVKNNLQIISSLLDIQSANIDDERLLSSMREGQSRVQAMSLIHQNLYQSKQISNIDIEKYLEELVAYLATMFAGADQSVKVKIDAEDITFDIDTAIPLGLIVNELVSNAYKHAFAAQTAGQITIDIRKQHGNDDYELRVKDDGKGLPEGFEQQKHKSLGLKLVKILSRQLRGNLSMKSEPGAAFTVKFKDLRAL
jgi:two-component sensor histidine kinase